MDVTRNTVLQWLETNRRSQKWLAEQCLVSDQAVSNWLRKNNPRNISASAQITIRRLMEEYAAANEAKPLHNMVLEFGDDDYSNIEQAALRAHKTVREWAKKETNNAAEINIVEFAKSLDRLA